MQYEMIQRTLVHRAGTAPDASAVADASISTWSDVAERLAPVIGARGVDALFNRSLHVTSKTYPWLAISGSGISGGGGSFGGSYASASGDEKGTARLASLKARLMDREPEEASEASYVLLLTFTALLASLIGESLTERLLEPVWVPPAQESEQESAA